jgi:phosphoglycolate phosphatase
LDHYSEALAVESGLFEGIPILLQTLAQYGLPWGIVTNKAARFTDPLVPQIGLNEARCVVSGDTTAHAKPHPEPLLEAARRLSLQPHQCWYVGDDLRDIQAGRAARMPTIAAAWGYCGDAEPVTWGADAIAATPAHLIELLHRSTT